MIESFFDVLQIDDDVEQNVLFSNRTVCSQRRHISWQSGVARNSVGYSLTISLTFTILDFADLESQK